MRDIYRVSWAEQCNRPHFISTKRLSGSKALGLRYERQLLAALRTTFSSPVHRGPWFHYKDHLGDGWCQPDFICEISDGALVLEAKLSWTREAEKQLKNYLCVLHQVYDHVIGAVVCKNLRPETPTDLVRGTLRDAVNVSIEGGGFGIWHCIDPKNALFV